MGQTPSAAEKKEPPGLLTPTPQLQSRVLAVTSTAASYAAALSADAAASTAAATPAPAPAVSPTPALAPAVPPTPALAPAVPPTPAPAPRIVSVSPNGEGAAPKNDGAIAEQMPAGAQVSANAKAAAKAKTLYVLRLESQKFYVGTSGNPAARFDAHKKGTGAAWTAKYPPLEIIKTEPDKTRQDEDAEVKRLMLEHGVDNVRGGSYVNVSLPAYQRAALAKELQHVSDKCFACGMSGHYAKECPNSASTAPRTGPMAATNLRKTAEGRPPPPPGKEEDLRQTAEALRLTAEKLAQTAERLVNSAAEKTPGEPSEKNGEKAAESLANAPKERGSIDLAADKADCARCNRNGHYRRACGAKSDASGAALTPEACVWCGRRGHNFATCTATTDSNGIPLKFKGCSRCGRKNHQAEKCFAKTDVFGDLPN